MREGIVGETRNCGSEKNCDRCKEFWKRQRIVGETKESREKMEKCGKDRDLW